RRSVVRGRVLQAHVPLFAGYLFLLADREERVAALSTRRVVRSLEVRAQDGLWRDLAQVHRLIGSAAPGTPHDRPQPRLTGAVRSGPLVGLRGTILSGKSGRRFVVQVDFIQRGASVMLDDFTLAAVDGHPSPSS